MLRVVETHRVQAAMDLQRNEEAGHGTALAKAHYAVKWAMQTQVVVVKRDRVGQPIVVPHALRVLVCVPVFIVGAIKDGHNVLWDEARRWVRCVDKNKLHHICQRLVQVGKLHLCGVIVKHVLVVLQSIPVS